MLSVKKDISLMGINIAVENFGREINFLRVGILQMFFLEKPLKEAEKKKKGLSLR